MSVEIAELPPPAIASLRTVLPCLARLCPPQAGDIDFDAIRLRASADGDGLPVSRLIGLAGEFGLMAQPARLDWARLQTAAADGPVLILLGNGNVVATVGNPPDEAEGAEEIVVSDPLYRDGEAFCLPRDALEPRWNGDALLVTPEPTKIEASVTWFTCLSYLIFVAVAGAMLLVHPAEENLAASSPPGVQAIAALPAPLPASGEPPVQAAAATPAGTAAGTPASDPPEERIALLELTAPEAQAGATEAPDASAAPPTPRAEPMEVPDAASAEPEPSPANPPAEAGPPAAAPEPAAVAAAPEPAAAAAEPVEPETAAATVPAGASEAPPAPVASSPPAAPPAPPSRTASLSPGETKALVSRGDLLVSYADLAGARLFYERAAEAGDAQAALRLGETYDPTFLALVRLAGGRSDRAAALSWYRRARELGAPEAEILLKSLGAK